jgi:hypothetical protein
MWRFDTLNFGSPRGLTALGRKFSEVTMNLASTVVYNTMFSCPKKKVFFLIPRKLLSIHAFSTVFLVPSPSQLPITSSRSKHRLRNLPKWAQTQFAVRSLPNTPHNTSLNFRKYSTTESPSHLTACDSRYGLAKQEQTSWAVRSSRKPEPIDEAIAIMKSKIASHHISIYEEWKDIRYERTVNWPWSMYKESLWNRVSHAMNLPMYEAWNWFSHDFGRRKTTLEEEQEQWKMLLEECRDLLPVVSELIEKLEPALDDEAAWVQEGGALTNAKTQPRYAYECVAVLLVIAAAHQKPRAQKRQALFNELDYATRKEYELKLPWKYQPWIQRNGSEAESDPEDDKVEETVCEVATGDDDQGIDLDLWDNVSDNEEDYTHDDTEGFHVALCPDDRAYAWDWYDAGTGENEELPITTYQPHPDTPTATPVTPWPW